MVHVPRSPTVRENRRAAARAAALLGVLVLAATPAASRSEEPAAPEAVAPAPETAAPPAAAPAAEAAPPPAAPPAEAAPAAEAPPAAAAPVPEAAPAAEAAPPPQAAPAAPSKAAASPTPPLGEDIVVTATRGARARRDAPAAVTVITQKEIEQSPSKTTDELLRVDPSFGLFRRSSSVAADPSSQGVNLRGIGPSGVSRSLVLLDGVPVNDPYGGWVYWRSLPGVGTDRIEVVPGGGSALYGNYAMGGVTQVFSSPITADTVRGYAEGGSFGTVQGGLWASDRLGPGGVAIQAEGFRSDGYDVVAPAQRGPIDGATPSSSAVVDARGDLAAGDDVKLRARTGYFWQDQNGGTKWTTAGVKQLDYSAGARWTPGAAGAFDLSIFGTSATFTQSRGRTNASRTTEVQAGWQDVPANSIGASALWASRRLELLGAHTLTVGGDGRQIEGTTHEDLYPATITSTTTVHRDTAGTQWLYGFFAQDVYDLSPAVSFQAAVRYDAWINADATQTTRTQAGATKSVDYARRTDEQWSPKLGLVVHPAAWTTLRASAYQSFRAPTLNELYRPFQVGQKVTLGNSDLGPEKLSGGEAGVDVTPGPALLARVTGFWTELKDPIVNVTIGSNLAQRENLGQARIRGVEASLSWRFARAWLAAAAYTFVEPTVTEAPGQPQLVGKDLPQDPRHRATASLSFDDPRILTATAQVRYYGAQFEDDVNTQRMAEFAVVDLSFTRRLSRTVDLVLAVENLLDKQYTVGLAGGLETIGQPRFIHGGLRFALDR